MFCSELMNNICDILNILVYILTNVMVPLGLIVLFGYTVYNISKITTDIIKSKLDSNNKS